MKYPNIEAERARAGMTLEQFAESLGVNRKTLYNWYSNGRISQSTLEQMSDLFGGCSTSYLLGLPDGSHTSKTESSFADRLRELLRSQDLTQAELSRMCGISRATLSRYLKGQFEAKQDTICKIASATGVSEAWLMGFDVPMHNGADTTKNERGCTMRIKLKEMTSCTGQQALMNHSTSFYDEVRKSLDDGDVMTAKAMISGLCIGFQLGKYGDDCAHEHFEEMVCNLIVQTMELGGLLDVFREV